MKRILIVDDDKLILSALSKTLQTHYPEVKAVSTGNDALSEISSYFYPLCFLDVSLPDSDGLQVMKKIKEISPETKVVIMTAELMDADMEREIHEGAFYFLVKPFDISEVKAITKQALEKTEKEIKERRQSERKPLKETINYSLNVFEPVRLMGLNLRGDIIDISDSGIGIRTYYLLEPGHLIIFTSGIEYRAGVVKWRKVTDDRYLAGIEFIEPENSLSKIPL